MKLYADGKLIDEGKAERTPPAIYTIDETFDVGIDRGAPVGSYPERANLGFPFIGGIIGEVTIAAK